MYKRFCHKHAGISLSSGTSRNEPKLLKMKLIIVVALALVATVIAAPPTEDYPKIVRSEFDASPDGAYNYNFETSNGIVRSETGELKEALDDDNKPHVIVAVRGSYSYTNTDGKPETITYFADETGYHAQGESIPQVASATS